MQITSIEGNSFSSGLTEAATIAQSKIEKLMNVYYDDPQLLDQNGDGTNQDTNGDGTDDVGPDFCFGLNNTGQNADQTDSLGRYNLYWNIAIDYPINGTKTIRVIVQWNEKGRQKQVAFTTTRTNI